MTRNPFKILNIVKHKTLEPFYWILWSLLTLFIVITNIVPNNDALINISQVSISNLIPFTSIGLIITIIVSLIGLSVFSRREYRTFLEKDPFIYYQTLSPFILTSSIWVISLILTTFAKINTLSLQSDVENTLNVLFIALITLGLVGILSIIITYIRDLIRKKKN